MSHDRRPLVDIIIPIFENLKFTEACLRTLYKYTDPETFRLIAVDNGSRDGTTDFLKRFKDVHSNMELVINTENLGWCKGLNIGFRYLHPESDYVLWCNNDILFEPEWLPKMIQHFRANVGAVGPTTNYAAGRQCIIYNHGHTEEDAPYLIGFCLMFRREVIDLVGDIDERFGLGGAEEFDYIIRMKKELSLRCVIARDVYIHHFGSMTLNKVCTDGTSEGYNNYSAKMDKVLREKWGSAVDLWLGQRLPNLLIGIVHPEYIHWQFWLSDKKMKVPPFTEFCNVARPALVYDARNDIVKKAKEIGARKLLMIDADMIVPENAIFRLMELDAAISAGYFFSRNRPHFPCAMRFVRESDGSFRKDDQGNKLLTPFYQPHSGVQDVDAVGAAFTLYDMKIFDEVSWPWFYPGAYGEDINICVKTRERGWKVKVDTDLIIKHIGRAELIDENNYAQANCIEN